MKLNEIENQFKKVGDVETFDSVEDIEELPPADWIVIGCDLYSRKWEDDIDDEIECSFCGGECEMNTEYEGSAVCKDLNCEAHKEE